MATRVEELRTVCRFCLSREDLMPLSEATRSAFAIKDVFRYTGILISCNTLPYAVCNECCEVIKNAVNFRRTCLKNDTIFKQLASILKGSLRKNAAKKETRAGDASLLITSDSQHNNTGRSRFEEARRCDTPIITLDDSDPDDGTAVLHEQIPNETITSKSIVQEEIFSPSNTTEVQPKIVVRKREDENASCSQHSNLGTLDDLEDDSNVLMPSLYSEVMQRDLNDKMISESSAYRLEAVDMEQSSITIIQESNNDAATSSVEINLITSDYSDSDDSMPSIYGDAMVEYVKEQKNKRNATGSGDPNVQTKKRPELCPICGIMSAYLPNHIKLRHQPVKKHVCPYCQKQFIYQFDVNRHINTSHEKRIILTCEQCGKGFINHSSHFYHMKNSHGKSDQYECEICHRKFKSIDGFKKHLKEHSLTSYPCSECDKLFKNARTLEKHKLRYHH